MIKECHLKEVWWYDTAICYALGMYYSLFKEKIENVLSNKIIYFVFFVITAIATFGLIACIELGLGKIFDLILMPVFTSFVVLLTMKVSFNNALLRWFGNHLFEIYILQRIPMILFSYFDLNKKPYLYLVVCFITTLLLAWGFKPLIDKTWKNITKKSN